MDKLFGIGLSKTGTKSLGRALKLLGYKVKHYPDPDDILAEAEKYDALCDTPVIPHYKELAALYPSAKFILTIRDVDDWLASCEHHWSQFRPHKKGLANRRRVFGREDFDADTFADIYRAHFDDVMTFFEDEPGRLLVLEITGGEGWLKLCEFLGIDLPFDFPHLR